MSLEGLLSNSVHMIDYLRNCSSEKHFIPKRKRLHLWVWRGNEWKRNVFYIIYVKQPHDFFGPCITRWSLSSCQTLALVPYYSHHVHVSLVYSVNSICFRCFRPFLVSSFYTVAGEGCRWMSEERYWNQRKRRENRKKKNEKEGIQEGKEWEENFKKRSKKSALW